MDPRREAQLIVSVVGWSLPTIMLSTGESQETPCALVPTPNTNALNTAAGLIIHAKHRLCVSIHRSANEIFTPVF